MHSHSAEMFKVLSIETRVEIIELLKKNGPMGSKIIAEQLNITPAAASQHLKILKNAGFVDSKREGFYIPYTVNEEALHKCHEALGKICHCGCNHHAAYLESDIHTMDIDSLKKYKESLIKRLEKVENVLKSIEEKGS